MAAGSHEAAWVAVATAAPVIEVGYVIVIERIIRLEIQLIDANKGHPKKARGAPLTIGGGVVFTVILNLAVVFGVFEPIASFVAAMNALQGSESSAQLGSAAFGLQLSMIFLIVSSVASILLWVQYGSRLQK